MKKLLFAFFAAMCCTVMANAEYSHATKIGNIWYSLNSANGTAEVTWGGTEPKNETPEYTGSITIPSTVTYSNKDFTVTGIGRDAFSYCTNLNSVILPNSVTSIGENAFDRCESLASITIPNSVTSIGKNAFDECEKLASITIPNSVTIIEARTFHGCHNLASVTIPNSVTSIKESAFSGCTSLTSIIIPSSVVSIGESAFWFCYKLAYVFWDGSVPQELGKEMFDYCSSLQKIVVCDNYADAYKSSFSSYSDKVETLKAFRDNALTEIPAAKGAIDYALTKQDETLIQYYTAAVATATTPSVAFTNKQCALGIISLRPKKNRSIEEIKWNVDAVEWKGIMLTDEEKATISGYVDAIELATDEETVATLRLSALNVVYLREAKVEAAAKLNALDAEYRGIDFSPYKDGVTNATSVGEVNDIMNEAEAIIKNGTFATMGSIKYLLSDVGGEYRHDGDITIGDKDLYQSDHDLTVKGDLTYSRTFKDTNWQALYVPFAMSYSEWKDKCEVASINNFHEYTDEDGKTVKTELEVRLVTSGTLKPNHPYLIKAKHADEFYPQEIKLTTRDIRKSDVESIDCSSTEWKYTFTGTYTKMTGLKTMDCIFMSGGKLCKAEDNEVALSPQRWYMTITPRGSQVDAGGSFGAGAMAFGIRLLDGETTGIDEITVTRTPLQDSSENVYNLNGMRVNDSYKGIVVKDGKKCVVK